MESQASEQYSHEDVRKSGYLRKHKSMHRRYFVLRAASERGPARLEYYESEKKFRGKAPVPKKVVALETCFNINKRADSKNKHMIVLYTRAESFAVAAENEADQDEWYQAMVELQCRSKRSTFAHKHAHMHAFLHVHTPTQIYVCAYICIYTHTHWCVWGFAREEKRGNAKGARKERTVDRDVFYYTV